MQNGTTPIPFDTSGNISYTTPASPISGIQDQYKTAEQGYAGAINAQPTVPQLTSQYNNQFGVPQLQQTQQNQQAQYTSLGDQMTAIPKDIQQGSQESILTQGQLDRMSQARQAPLLAAQTKLGTQMAQTGQQLSTAQTNAGQMISAEQAQQTKQLLPWTQQFSDLNVTTAQQMTGWTTQDSDQLSVLLANQKTGQLLTHDEQLQLESLASKEQDFENTLKSNAQQEQLGEKSFTFQHPDPLGLLM